MPQKFSSRPGSRVGFLYAGFGIAAGVVIGLLFLDGPGPGDSIGEEIAASDGKGADSAQSERSAGDPVSPEFLRQGPVESTGVTATTDPANFGAGGPASRSRQPRYPELAQRMSRSTEGLTVVEHPGGRRSMHLGGRFFHVSAAVTDSDGNRRVRCFTDYRALEEAVTQVPARGSAPPPSDAIEKKVEY